MTTTRQERRRALHLITFAAILAGRYRLLMPVIALLGAGKLISDVIGSAKIIEWAAGGFWSFAVFAIGGLQ